MHLFTVCSREMTGSESLSPMDFEELFRSATSTGPGRQGAFAIPTICPWMAVPTTVPRTSIVIPDWGETWEMLSHSGGDTLHLSLLTGHSFHSFENFTWQLWYSLYAVAESLSFCSELMNMVRAEYGTWKHWFAKEEKEQREKCLIWSCKEVTIVQHAGKCVSSHSGKAEINSTFVSVK